MEILSIATGYATRVLGGEIPACEFVHLACSRLLEDLRVSRLKRPPKDFPWRWDEKRAARVVRYIQALPHVKGPKARLRQRVTLEAWQIFIEGQLFGWVHKDTGVRRFLQAYVEVPRKNGKTLKGAGTGLYMMSADWEAGAEVYAAATSMKQARELFDTARMMVEKAPDLRSALGVEAFAGAIVQLHTGSKFHPLASIPRDGANPSCVLIDEYHEHKTSALKDSLETGQVSREQPLSLTITTAGTDITGPCYQLRSDIEKILRGAVTDHRVFGIIYTINKDTPWDTEDALRMANPNFGVSVEVDKLLAALAVAKRDPGQVNKFKTKHLNIWVTARDPFFDSLRWGELDSAPKLESLDKAEWRFFFGLDLAKNYDFTALLVWAENLKTGELLLYPFFWYPREVAEERRDIPVLMWAEQKDVILTPGEVMDQEFIKQAVRDLASELRPEAIAFDHWNANALVQELLEEGLPMVEVTMTVKSLSSAMYAMRDRIQARQVKHPGNRCMDWMLSNVTAKVDANDNVFPRKESRSKQIDGPVAAMMGLALMARSPRPPPDALKGMVIW